MILSGFGAKARSAASRLEALLDDPSPLVRVEAAVALLSVDPANPRILPALNSELDSNDIDVLVDAILAITKIGPRCAILAPKLKKIVSRMDLTSGTRKGDDLTDEVFAAKANAAEALVAVAPVSGEGVEALIALLNVGEHGEGPAIEVLGRLGPRASAAVPALVAVARNTKSVYRFKAIQAVTRIDPRHDAILPILIALLSVEPPPNEPGKGEDDRERSDIISTIGRMREKALPAVPSLVPHAAEATRGAEQNFWEDDEKNAAARAWAGSVRRRAKRFPSWSRR